MKTETLYLTILIVKTRTITPEEGSQTRFWAPRMVQRSRENSDPNTKPSGTQSLLGAAEGRRTGCRCKLIRLSSFPELIKKQSLGNFLPDLGAEEDVIAEGLLECSLGQIPPVCVHNISSK